MDNLINMVDSAVEVNIDENLLQQFMSKVMVWDYNSREIYLALSWNEKKKIIRGYYSKCELCYNFRIYKTKLKKNNFLVRKDVIYWKVTFREKNKHFTISQKP